MNARSVRSGGREKASMRKVMTSWRFRIRVLVLSGIVLSGIVLNLGLRVIGDVAYNKAVIRRRVIHS
jgi:hypothetical protein